MPNQERDRLLSKGELRRVSGQLDEIFTNGLGDSIEPAVGHRAFVSNHKERVSPVVISYPPGVEALYRRLTRS